MRGVRDRVLGPAELGPMPSTAPETSTRQCPSCQSGEIVHAGHVIAGKGMLKSKQRCEVCGAAFWFVRKRNPLTDALAAATDEELGIVTPGGIPSRRSHWLNGGA